MSTRPVIFISAVSRELRSARDLVAKTLIALGYDPKWQDIAPTETGDLRGVLRKWIDDSDAVLQLVGHCYGFASDTLDPEFGDCSYTQYEALYARQKGKPVYYILTDVNHPTDGCACEPKELHELQEQYRQQVKAHGVLYHSTSSLTQTELHIHRIKDELAHFRRRSKQHAALVLALLIVLVVGIYFLMREQQHTDETLDKTAEKIDQQGQALADLRQMLETIKGGSEAKLTADYDIALRFIAQKHGIGLDAFRAFLHQNATLALGDAAVSLKAKVRALQEAGQFLQARDFALVQARRLENEKQKINKEAAELWTEAAKTEITLGHYATALEHAIQAVNQTDRLDDFPTWSAARHQQGRALRYLRKDLEVLDLYKELIPLQQAAFGPYDLAVLQSRRLVALSLDDQGSYVLAEQQGRALVADCQRVLGVENHDTLASRNNLAGALQGQGKNVEAEKEYRVVSQLLVRVLGAEHPNTLSSRMGVANALYSQAKYAEAEQEYRGVLQLQERVLGAEHPNTLSSRMGMANALYSQTKYAEAEEEFRAVSQIQQRVLGSEHPHTLMSRMNLATTLNDQGKHAEAEQEHRAVTHAKERVLGQEHPHTLMSRMNLANTLKDQGKHADAEQEQRAVLQIQERVLDTEHPDVATSCHTLALCLKAQQKLPEALQFMQRAEQIRTKMLGPDHLDTKDARRIRERFEAELKSSTPLPGTAK